MWWIVIGGGVSWLLMAWWLDGPSVPAWEARNNYKLMNGVLMLLLVLMAIKSHGWHMELTALIPYCQ